MKNPSGTYDPAEPGTYETVISRYQKRLLPGPEYGVSVPFRVTSARCAIRLARMTYSILFVCLGNICRSPTAEAVIRKLGEEAGLSLTLDSAGTGDWHVGEPPYGPMQAAARKRGYDLSPLRARQVSAQDFYDFDLILAMDDSNLTNIESLRPEGLQTPVQLMLDYLPDQPVRNVPDPYFTREFDRVIDLIEVAGAHLITSLKRQN